MTDFLKLSPFNLDDAAIRWVEETIASLSFEEKVAQLFVLISRGNDAGERETLKRLKPGGITRFFGPDGPAECAALAGFQADARVPMLVSADLEGSRMSLAFATKVLNPLGLAAIDDIEVTRRTSRIMAEEALAVGVNWSFTPVLDINAAFRSAIVATRGFGSDVEIIRRHAIAQIEEFQKLGLAATAKHWPGEGYDDRDQHLVTTINPLSIEDWEKTFGSLYRDAIGHGVMSVMSAHIAFPAFVRSIDPDAGLEAYRPASVSRLLNIDLLRERLGFNGVIVSDASEMAGLGAWQELRAAKPELIANGCDVVLFSREPEADMAAVAEAVRAGRISGARFRDALLRVLGLKAALGLHQGRGLPDPEVASRLGRAENRKFAQDTFRKAPTLVKDNQNLLPLDPAVHKRVLVVSGGVVSPLHGAAKPLVLPELMRAKGFEITLFERGKPFAPQDHDLVLYLFAEETLLTRNRIFIDWLELMGDFGLAMMRSWHSVPTAMISLGYPYYLYDAPRVPTYINAYSTLDEVQDAVLALMLGNADWNRHSPVDAFCGLDDARY
jgi:beta-N-acetylhexosaminidase